MLLSPIAKITKVGIGYLVPLKEGRLFSTMCPAFMSKQLYHQMDHNSSKMIRTELRLFHLGRGIETISLKLEISREILSWYYFHSKYAFDMRLKAYLIFQSDNFKNV